MPIDEDYHAHVRTDVVPLVPRGGRLLDAGGGIGATARALREAGLVERAGVVDLVAAGPGHGLDFAYSGDLAEPGLLERIGEAEGPFDTVLALDFLEHLLDPWAMVGRLHRLLRPGGCLIISVPNVRHYSVSCSLLFRGEWIYQ